MQLALSNKQASYFKTTQGSYAQRLAPEKRFAGIAEVSPYQLHVVCGCAWRKKCPCRNAQSRCN